MRRVERDDMVVTCLQWAAWGIIAAAALHLSGAPWWVTGWVSILGLAPMAGAAVHLMGE